MPGGDRTGPLGHGPMTGRGLGLCSGYPQPGYVLPRFGRGGGRGFGRGIWGRRAYWRRPLYYDTYNDPIQTNAPSPNKEEEKAYLENMVKGLEAEIKEIRERIKTLSEEKQ